MNELLMGIKSALYELIGKSKEEIQITEQEVQDYEQKI